MTDFIQILTTTDTKETAERIARRLLERRLAGCVQVSGPITSSYWWKGKIETSEEWACAIKTRAEQYPEVEREICAVHPYEVPEILAFPVALGSKTYLSWLADSVRVTQKKARSAEKRKRARTNERKQSGAKGSVSESRHHE